MKSTALLVLVVTSTLFACSSSRDELSKAVTNRTPVAHNTIVDCPVYDGMKKTSAVLAKTTTGTEVQVTDTINAYFVRVRLEQDGQTKTGYMDRRCFGERGVR
jgi:glycerate kinase